MKTKDLIELLKKLDPDGNMEIWLNGCYYDYQVENVEKHKGEDAYSGEPVYWLEIR